MTLEDENILCWHDKSTAQNSCILQSPFQKFIIYDERVSWNGWLR